MSEENKIEYKREPGLCVIRDDDHGWGGPDQEENKPIEKKVLKPMPCDAPINWPFNRYR